MDTVALLPQSELLSLRFSKYFQMISMSSKYAKPAFGGTGLAQ
jgi:hypothetical protein